MLAFRWRWSVAKNFSGFALARYKIPLALVLLYKIFAGAGANANQQTSGPAEPLNSASWYNKNCKNLV